MNDLGLVHDVLAAYAAKHKGPSGAGPGGTGGTGGHTPTSPPPETPTPPEPPETSPPAFSPNGDFGKRQLWKRVLGVICLLFLLSLIVGWYWEIEIPFTSDDPATAEDEAKYWNWGIVLFWAIVAWSLSGFGSIGPSHRATVLFLGKPIADIDSGWYFIIPGLFRVVKQPKPLVAIQMGRVYPKRVEGDVSEEEKVPAEMYKKTEFLIPIAEPFRVTFADAALAEDDWTKVKTKSIEEVKSANPTLSKIIEALRNGVTGGIEELFKRLTTDPMVFIWVRVESPSRLIQRAGGSIEQWSRSLAKQAEAQLQEYCGKHTVAYVLAMMDEANTVLQEGLERHIRDLSPSTENLRKEMERDKENWSLLSWGLNVEAVRIVTLGLPYHVNLEMAKARSAGFEKEKAIQAAIGQEETERRVGKGKADATREMKQSEAAGRRAWMEAEAAGMESQVRVLGSPEGRFNRVIESQETIAEHAKPMIITGGGGGNDSDSLLARASMIWNTVEKQLPGTRKENEQQATPPAAGPESHAKTERPGPKKEHPEKPHKPKLKH